MSYQPPDQNWSYQHGYTGLGAYEQQQKPTKNRTAIIVLCVVLAVVVIGGGVTAAILLTSKSGNANAAAGPPPATTTSSSPSPRAVPITKWTTVTNSAAGVQYKVPATWQVMPAGTYGEIGSIKMGGVAEDYPFTCANNPMIRAEMMSGIYPGTDPQTAASTVATNLANSSYDANGSRPTHQQPLTESVQRGGVNGVLAIITVTTTGASPCYAPKADIAVMALPKSNGSGCVVVVLNNAIGGPYADRSLSEDQMTQVMNTIEPAG